MAAHGGLSGVDGLVGNLGRWSRSRQSLGRWSRNQVGRWVSDEQLAGVVGEQRRAAWVRSEGTRSGKLEEEVGGLVGEGREVEMEIEELLLAGEAPMHSDWVCPGRGKL